MIRNVFQLFPEGRVRDVAFSIGGATAVIAGQRLAGLSMLGRGVLGAERRWHDRHPEFDGSWSHRWDLAMEAYDDNHTTRMNRLLHAVGLPLMVGGAAGLLFFRSPNPLWVGSLGSLTVGLGLGLLGHVAFEEDMPVSSNDLLASVAGPWHDLRHIGLLVGATPVDLSEDWADTITIYDGEPVLA